MDSYQIIFYQLNWNAPQTGTNVITMLYSIYEKKKLIILFKLMIFVYSKNLLIIFWSPAVLHTFFLNGNSNGNCSKHEKY